MIKISVCWQPHLVLMEHIFSRWNSQSLNGDIKYSLKISLIGLVIQNVRPNYFSKKLLKYIFMKLDFINI